MSAFWDIVETREFSRGLRGFHGNFKGRVKGFRVNGTKFIVAESDEKYI